MLYCYVKKQEVTIRHLSRSFLNWCIQNIKVCFVVLFSRLLSLSMKAQSSIDKAPFRSGGNEKKDKTDKKKYNVYRQYGRTYLGSAVLEAGHHQ